MRVSRGNPAFLRMRLQDSANPLALLAKRIIYINTPIPKKLLFVAQKAKGIFMGSALSRGIVTCLLIFGLPLAARAGGKAKGPILPPDSKLEKIFDKGLV